MELVSMAHTQAQVGQALVLLNTRLPGRQAESYETEANRWRLEALRQERERSSNSAKPVDPNPYNFPEAVYGPNGRMMLCTKGFPG